MRSKLVKVFIASSAELDQDKTMFDVYFSDKNKLYRKRILSLTTVLGRISAVR